MIKNTYNVIKSKSAAILALIMAAFVCFALIGCNKDYTVEDAANIARERFGCTKILWVGRAVYKNNTDGCDLSMNGGYYVVGLDKDKNEVYVVVPKNKSDKFTATAFEWPFDYTFSQIAKVYEKYGYKYIDGIDGKEAEYFYSHTSKYINLIDTEFNVKIKLDSFGDKDEMYELLDVKLMFEFTYLPEDGVLRFYYLVQENGLLKMYEKTNGDLENFTVTIYGEDEINALM